MKKVLICVFTLSFYSLGQAQTIKTDRPDQTEASSTVPVKSLQIESGFQFSSNGTSRAFQGTAYSGADRQILAPTNLFRVGITKQIELRVLSQIELNSTFNPRVNKSPYRSYMSDLEVGTKVQIYQKEGAKTEVAFLTHLGLPTGSESTSAGELYSISKLCISHKITDGFSIGYNVGYNTIQSIDDVFYSASFGFSLTDKLSVYCEPYGLINVNKIARAGVGDQYNFDAGFTYLLNNNTQLDWSFGSGINHDMNYVAAGCSWLIK